MLHNVRGCAGDHFSLSAVIGWLVDVSISDGLVSAVSSFAERGKAREGEGEDAIVSVRDGICFSSSFATDTFKALE